MKTHIISIPYVPNNWHTRVVAGQASRTIGKAEQGGRIETWTGSGACFVVGISVDGAPGEVLLQSREASHV